VSRSRIAIGGGFEVDDNEEFGLYDDFEKALKAVRDSGWLLMQYCHGCHGRPGVWHVEEFEMLALSGVRDMRGVTEDALRRGGLNEEEIAEIIASRFDLNPKEMITFILK
jgi:hypothetical protein